MTNLEELKAMIKCFRVVDLQVLLLFAGRSKRGKKQELQDRALKLLQLQSQPLVLKIRSIYDSVPRSSTKNENEDRDDSSEPEAGGIIERDDDGGFLERSDDIAIVDENVRHKKTSCSYVKRSGAATDPKGKFQNCPVQLSSNAQLALNSLCLPVHPDVKFKKLPFYKVMYELLRPSSLVPQSCNIQQRNVFSFYITPQQAAEIFNSRITRPGLLDEFTVLVLLRFCLLETTSVQNDTFPACLVLRINNKYCYIQENALKKKKNECGRELAPPVDITPLMKLTPSQPNKIEVQWNTEYGAAFVVGVYLVQKKTSEDLLNHLKSKGVRSADYTRGMIKDKLNEEADSEIVTTSLRVSLMCPLGKTRLRTPCRATTCRHLQCFDAAIYIQLNERKPTWLCPVCDKPAEYDQLFVDGYFLEILSSEKLPLELNEIELQSDGLWTSSGIKPVGRSSVKVETDDVDVILDDGEEVLPTEADLSQTSDDATVQVEAEKRKVDEIDLTISDSDDEPLIYYKRRESTRNKRNCLTQTNFSSGSSSSPSSPMVINLDSDSSDSLPLLIPTQFLPPLL